MKMKYDIGIDLGTTYSCLAMVDPATGQPVVVKNNLEHDTTPSVIAYTDDEGFIVGEVAKDMAEFVESSNYIEAIKRNMSEVDTYPKRDLGGKLYGPVELSAVILKKMLTDFKDKYPDADVSSLTVTCPAYFGPAEREATKQAGEIACSVVFDKELNDVQVTIVEEPVAAAISYGLKNGGDKNLLIYDLGGGTFDVTVVRITNGEFEVIAKEGNPNLGGKDWDARLVEIIKDNLCDASGIDLDELEADEEAVKTLRVEAEAKKILLSTLKEAKGFVNVGVKPLKYAVSREEFEAATAGLLDSADEKVDKALTSAGLTLDQIDDVVMVGGSTKMPQVKARLIANHPEIESKIHVFEPDLAVAKGAAIYQSTLGSDPGDGDIVLRNVLPYTMGVKVVTGEEVNGELLYAISNILFRNSTLPLRNKNQYGVHRSGQTTLNIEIFQSEFDSEPEVPVEECIKVGEFPVQIPSDSVEGEPVMVAIEAKDPNDIVCECTFRGKMTPYTIDFGGRALSDEEKERGRTIV